jgi:hypothetical protein
VGPGVLQRPRPILRGYVGRQLRLLRDVEVYSEISYYPRKDLHKSVDWIVVFPNLVLLVEAKARRSTEQLRSGAAGAAEGLQQAFDKANRQLETTCDLIKARAPEFATSPQAGPLSASWSPWRTTSSPTRVSTCRCIHQLPSCQL